MSKQINIGGRVHSVEVDNVVAGANEILDDTKGKKQNVINADVDAELLRLDQSKQNNLTFDNTPTENSTNPVTSGGVYAANITLHELIEAILALIPSAASALNQLADKAFVNSSVSTATATFRGTYNVVTDLELAYDATHEQIATKLGQVIATADNNDYAFVQIPVSATSTDIRRTERYKFNGTVWGYEYDLNTSGFTAAQWEAINSGITALLVSKLTNLPTAEVLATMFNAKQNVLTFDAAPTALSTNPVYSGGVYAAIKAITDLIPSEATALNQLADKAYVAAQILAAIPACKGQFETLVELQAVQSPKVGDLGIVRTKDSDGKDVFTFYQYLNNAWNVYFSLSYHPQTKPATTGTTGDYPYNGMGRVELAKNMVNTGTELAPVMVNQLTQDMFYKGAVGSRVPNTNTIFVIRYDYVLAESITIPDNCVLEFEGGSISGSYTLTGANTGIKAGLVKIFDTTTTLAGTWNVAEAYPEWFGAKGDGVNDDRQAVQNAITLSDTIIMSKNYLIINAPFDWTNYNPIPQNEADYTVDLLTQKNNTDDSELTPIIIGSNKTIVLNGNIKGYSPLGNIIEITGNNNTITGGGTIEGCGIVNSVTGYIGSGTQPFDVIGWPAGNIYVSGSNNIINEITIKNPVSEGVHIALYAAQHNVVKNCIIGGGLVNHTENTANYNYTALFGIYAKGSGTVICNNTFKRIDGKALYDTLYCNYTDAGEVPETNDERNFPQTLYENNIVEEVLEHGVYSYAPGLVIRNNTFHKCHGTTLQLFQGHQIVEGNIIKVFQETYHNNAMMLSGERQIVKSNKIFNCGGYAIRLQGYYNGSCDYSIVEGNYIEKDMSIPFSSDNPNTTPAITFESSSFRDNKLVIDHVICSNNTIICKNDAIGRQTPIIGVIAVLGDQNSTFKHLEIKGNTVSNSNVANNISVELKNATRDSFVEIVDNVCVNDKPILSSIKYDPILKLIGFKQALVRGNKLEQRGTTDGVTFAGCVFQLYNYDFALFSENVMKANINSGRGFYVAQTGYIMLDGTNIVGDEPIEKIVTIQSGTNQTVVNFQVPDNSYNAEIIPLNDYARTLQNTDPVKQTDQSAGSITIGVQNNVSEDAVYMVRVIYHAY